MAKRKKINKKQLPFVAAIVIILLIVSSVMENMGIWDKINSYTAPTVSDSLDSDDYSENALMNAYFLDVGQGDSSLFISGEESMLIDSGEAEYADSVISSLKSYGVTDLDYVVVTHAHTDHMGGMAEILDAVPTENIIMSEPSDGSSGTKSYGNFLDAADRSGADIIIAEPDYTFTLGEAECRILAPFSVSSKEENNNSVVMHITAGTTSFLMTGDAEKSLEKSIIYEYPDLSATFLKLGHHGSNTSSCNEFLEQINPDNVIISVGIDNNYGHPTDEVLSRLDEHSIFYLRTDLNGTIRVSCSPDDYHISCQR